MEDKDFKVFINHIDKVDLSDSINISKEDEEKFLETLVNSSKPNEELKKLFESLFTEDKQKLKDFIEKNYKNIKIIC